jgi:hypothetical protein
MPFWDNNSGGAVPADSGNPAYNYALEQEQLKRQRALAQGQFDTQMPQGQMVSGWYVAPNGGSYLAAGLNKMLGAYGLNAADKGEKDNATKAQANVTALAQALQRVKGEQAGVGPDGNPTYSPASFTDKLPVYQQLQNAGPFGQFVAQHGIERDLAGPTFQKVGEGEKLYQFNKDGRLLGQLSGGDKRTELERKADMIRQAYPNASPQLISGLATGTIIFDDNSGKLIDKATGRDANYGAATNFPQATGGQPPVQPQAPTGPVTVPARGQTFSGPPPASVAQPATAFPQATNSAQGFRQQKQLQDTAPKLKEAQDGLASLTQLKKNYDELESLLATNPTTNHPQITTGHARGAFADATHNLFDNSKQDRLESLLKGLSLNTIQSMPGMTQVFNSNEEGKRLAATLPNRSYDNSANLANIKAARALLAEKQANLATQIQSLGGQVPSQSSAQFSW